MNKIESKINWSVLPTRTRGNKTISVCVFFWFILRSFQSTEPCFLAGELEVLVNKWQKHDIALNIDSKELKIISNFKCMWYNSIITTIYCLSVVIRTSFSISYYIHSSQQFNEEFNIIILLIGIKKLRLVHLRICPKLKTIVRHSTNSIWLPSSCSSLLICTDTYTYRNVHLHVWVKAVDIDSWVYEAASRVLKNYTTFTLCIFFWIFAQRWLSVQLTPPVTGKIQFTPFPD